MRETQDRRISVLCWFPIYQTNSLLRRHRNQSVIPPNAGNLCFFFFWEIIRSYFCTPPFAPHMPNACHMPQDTRSLWRPTVSSDHVGLNKPTDLTHFEWIHDRNLRVRNGVTLQTCRVVHISIGLLATTSSQEHELSFESRVGTRAQSRWITSPRSFIG